MAILLNLVKSFFASLLSLFLNLLVSVSLTLSVRTLVYVFLADVVLDYFLHPDSVCYVAPGRLYICLHFPPRIVLFAIFTAASALPLAF